MRLLFKYRSLLMVIVLGMTAFFGYSLKDFKVDFSFDAFRPKDEPEYEFFKTYLDTFPHYENTVMVALKSKGKDIWEPDFLGAADSLFEQLRTIPRLDTLISPTRLEHYQRQGMGLKAKPLIDLAQDSGFVQAKSLIRDNELIFQHFFSQDSHYIAGLLMVEPEILDLAERDSVSHAMRRILDASGMEYVASGVPYIRTQYVETIRKEVFFFLGLSVIFAVIVMLWLFRSWWGVLLPQIGVGLGLVWTFGFMAATGQPLDLVGELLPTVMFVVAIGDIIHLITKYQQDLQKGLPAQQAMELTVREIGAAVFLTSLTTAIGFASLFSSPLPPIKSFGLYAAAGVMFAYLIAIVLIPNILLKIPAQQIRQSKGAGESPKWTTFLEFLYRTSNSHPKWIIGAVLGLIIFSIVGVFQISYDNYLLDDISKQDPIRKDLAFFEDNFYGARPFEMALTAKGDRLVTDLEILEDMDTIQSFLRGQLRMSPFLSLANYLKGANQLYRGGNPRAFKLPSSQEKVEELMAFGYGSGAEDYLSNIVSPTEKTARMSARMGDIGSERFEILSDSLQAFIQRTCRPDNFEYHLTGTAVINEANAVYLREGLFSSLALAIGLIAILMALLFKDWKMALVGMIPNIIPLLFTAGMMGFMGITLRSSTSIVFLVAFGIAVDDTIHFLSRYRLEIKDGLDIPTALKNTFLGTGKAMILTTVILLSGFSFLLTSNFGGTFVVGFFTAITLVIALLADLLLLPVLIQQFGIGRKMVGKQNENQE